MFINRQQQHPWNEGLMSQEPPTHVKNKEFKEKYLNCFDETYNLTNPEIKEWWNLRLELYPLY